ncbi:MAG: hypothetical protein RMK94_14765, partial [Armatimonadota bacterium]|nr:hypothetical protein [Armatimonadota bacterium]
LQKFCKTVGMGASLSDKTNLLRSDFVHPYKTKILGRFHLPILTKAGSDMVLTFGFKCVIFFADNLVKASCLQPLFFGARVKRLVGAFRLLPDASRQ